MKPSASQKALFFKKLANLNEFYQVTEKRFTYQRHEKLKSRKLTDELFSSGKTFQQFPLKCFWLVKEADAFSLQAGVGVSKRYFKKAVHRNRIKRLLRESFRLHKHLLTEANLPPMQLSVFFLYTDKELPTQELMHEKVKATMNFLLKKLHATA